MIDINPLNILGIRSLGFIPEHFAKFKIGENYLIYSQKELEQWITHNLDGRFAICSLPEIDSDDRLKVNTFVGFESHRELTLFMLSCPLLRRK